MLQKSRAQSNLVPSHVNEVPVSYVPINSADPFILPQDLVDDVIGYLQPDIKSLKQCSLVCRSWLLASRPRMFRKLVFTQKNTFVLAEITTALPCSTILPYVREIEFQGIGHLFDSNFSTSHLLCHFSSTVTHLRLCDITFDNFQCVLKIISSMPYLQCLQLNRVYWGKSGESEDIESTVGSITKELPSSLARLDLKDTNLKQFALWILSHPVLPIIPHIEMGSFTQEDVPHAGKYISLIGPSITHLSFSFSSGENDHMCFFNLFSNIVPDPSGMLTPAIQYQKCFGLPVCNHLSTLTNLRYFRIERFLDNETPRKSACIYWAPRLVASINPYVIEHMVLGLNLSRAGDLDNTNVNWRFFDYVLSHHTYSNLRILEFELKGRAQVDSVANLLALRLPAVSGRGILRCSKETQL